PGLQYPHAVERLDDRLVHHEAREGPWREEVLAAQADRDPLPDRPRVCCDHGTVDEGEGRELRTLVAGVADLSALDLAAEVSRLARRVVVLRTEPDLRPQVGEELRGDVLVPELRNEALVRLGGDDRAAFPFAAFREEVPVAGLGRVTVVLIRHEEDTAADVPRAMLGAS